MKSEEHPPRRILITADAVGGVWQYSVDLIEALSSRGYEILLATLGPRPSQGQTNQIAALGNVHLVESDLKLEWMPDPWKDVDRSSQWLLSLEREFKPNIVHLNGYSQASAPFEAPVITVAHSCVYSWWNAVHGSEPGPEWLEYKHRVSQGLSACSAVMAPSRFMADAVMTHYRAAAAKICVIHNFSSFEQSGRSEKAPYILAAGRMWDQAKNLALLHSMAGHLQWRLRVAGEDGADRRSGVQSLGYLRHSDLLEQMARAAIFAHPALYEPFGLAVLEAAKAGCCLVLADIPSLRELWDGAAVFIDARDQDSWVKELNRLIDNRFERERLGREAARHAKKYTPEATISAYLNLYESLIRNKQAENGVAA